MSVARKYDKHHRENDMLVERVGPLRAMQGALLHGKAADHPPGSSTPRHWHEVTQLLYAISGVMRVITPHGQWIVPPNRGIWVPPGVWHEVLMIGHVEVRSLYVRPDAVPGLPEECCVLEITPLMRELILAAISIDYEVQPMPPRQRLIAELLLNEVKSLPTLSLQLPMPADPLLAPICRALLAEPDDARSSEDWANHAGLEVRTLQRRFRKATGMTLGDWRRQARLLNALERLAQGERVLDVALDCGYNSPSAFSAMFKRQFACSPSDFFA
ncbi:AraC family transcriptional regulator [Chitinibacter tainanensis]|uniref:AraC family transcriptional regulator n=1 Tax=Chitinibacter tainanensis TaxID=230667 RepID=UPI0004033705|nr:helix-turn-helix transcriptional regulator [Chitinibacter tainanensis]